MTCHNCEIECKKFGKNRNGSQLFRCAQCSKTFSGDAPQKPLNEMRFPMEKATKILQLLLEGCSIRSVERITDVHRDTILRLLVVAGAKCERLLEDRIKNVTVKDVQCDEIWGYVYKKEGHKWMYEMENETIGDAYCFVGMERGSKLILAWHLGKRTPENTQEFIDKLQRSTSSNRFQISTDGFTAYTPAIENTYGANIDYGKIVKVYGSSREGEQRYSPAEVTNAVPTIVSGNPDKTRICTSHIERQNLSIRMGMRRMTRLTNAFSKKWDNLKAAYALWFAFYNFCRIHRTIRMTPAMEAGIENRVWEVADLLA